MRRILFILEALIYFTEHFRIDSNLEVRLGDNALARDLFPADYHCLGDNENRPIKWLSLEAIEDNCYTNFSDVVCRCCIVVDFFSISCCVACNHLFLMCSERDLVIAVGVWRDDVGDHDVGAAAIR